MAYIRRTYGVPAKRGGRVRFDYASYGEGRILSAVDGRLRVQFEGGESGILHPTWQVTYLDDDGKARS